jgi:hypothetical protein
MNPAEVVFLYLPIPYWVAFALLLYRHDLSRLLHPFREDGSLRNWWAVLSKLGILDKGARRPSRKKEILPYVVCLLVSAGVSLSWTLRVSPLVWYYFIIVQGISGIVLTAATVQYLGAPPRRPFVDVLRYPRLGSRIRHLPNVSSPEQADGQQSLQPRPQVSGEPQAAILDGQEKSN